MLVNISSVTKSFGDRLLFKNVDMSVEKGMKIGLIGANGSGKTTLFRLIIGTQLPDSGVIARQSGLNIGYLEQHVCADSKRTAYDETLQVFSPLIKAETELARLTQRLENDHSTELIEKHNAMLEKFQADGGLTFRSRTRSALLGLGFTEKELSLTVDALSGGQKSKIGLAKLLLSEPELMLLDEPTNHLDMSSVIWLEEFLQQSKCTCIIISHDRWFLDRTTTHTAEIYTERLYFTKGNYSRYQELKEARVEAEQRHYDNVMDEVHRIEQIIKQQRKWNRERNIRMAESKEKQIARMTEDLYCPEYENNSISFEFTAPEVSGNDVLKAEGLSVAFDGKCLYKDVSLDIKSGEKVFIVGNNGCGKTTLIKSLLHPEKYNVTYGVGVKTGYFDQHQQNLTLKNTAFDELRNAFLQKSDTELRSALAVFGFRGDDVFKTIEEMSGGERARVSLCKLMLTGANLLILDEPTNHLDIYSVAALEDALSLFKGTMLVVSHDRYFINSLATSICELSPDGITKYIGNYDEYFLKAAEKKAPPAEAKPMGAGKEDYLRRKAEKAEHKRMLSQKKALEDRIAALEAENDELTASLNVADASDYETITALTTRIAEINAEYEKVLDEWEKNEQKISAAGSNN